MDPTSRPAAAPRPLVPMWWVRPRRIDRRPEGARSGGLADYKLVCEAGSYELDVLVREVEEPRGFELQGQVTHAGKIHEPVARLTVDLVQPPDAARVSASKTDDFGEFGFDRRSEGVYGLRLGEGDDAPCVLVWEGAFERGA